MPRLSQVDPNFIFVLKPDASNYQLGTIGMQYLTETLSLDAHHLIIYLASYQATKILFSLCSLVQLETVNCSVQLHHLATLKKELLSIAC